MSFLRAKFSDRPACPIFRAQHQGTQLPLPLELFGEANIREPGYAGHCVSAQRNPGSHMLRLANTDFSVLWLSMRLAEDASILSDSDWVELQVLIFLLAFLQLASNNILRDNITCGIHFHWWVVEHIQIHQTGGGNPDGPSVTKTVRR